MQLTYIYKVTWYSPANNIKDEQLVGVRAAHLSMADQAIREYAFDRTGIMRTHAVFLLKTADEITMVDLGEGAGRAKIALRA